MCVLWLHLSRYIVMFYLLTKPIAVSTDWTRGAWKNFLIQVLPSSHIIRVQSAELIHLLLACLGLGNQRGERKGVKVLDS